MIHFQAFPTVQKLAPVNPSIRKPEILQTVQLQLIVQMVLEEARLQMQLQKNSI
jgi:hypothetical protein